MTTILVVVVSLIVCAAITFAVSGTRLERWWDRISILCGMAFWVIIDVSIAFTLMDYVSPWRVAYMAIIVSGTVMWAREFPGQWRRTRKR